MKKKLIITESQYKRLINEQDDYTEQLLSLINSNTEDNLLMVKEMLPGLGIDLVEFLKDNIKQIKPPYFYKFNILEINKEEIKEIFINLYSEDIHIIVDPGFVNREMFIVEDPDGNILYYEDTSGFWEIRIYNSEGEVIYLHNSDGGY
jgi:hypothetical protein